MQVDVKGSRHAAAPGGGRGPLSARVCEVKEPPGDTVCGPRKLSMVLTPLLHIAWVLQYLEEQQSASL